MPKRPAHEEQPELRPGSKHPPDGRAHAPRLRQLPRVLDEADLDGSRGTGRSVVLPDESLTARAVDFRQNLSERTRALHARLDRHWARKRAQRTLEVGMAPLGGDEGDHGALRAAEASQHCVPGRLREGSLMRSAAPGLVVERPREDVVYVDRDLLRRAGARSRAREREHRRGDVSKLLPERARRAGLVGVGVPQLVLPC